ncbi:peptidoglycan-binding protein [Streptomyces sp. NPDC002793]|uniref:peptidoglycan-binding domain-containing protein n=1 Tax=Streptomyces sp. NPDC002793 TaxID=3154432 RepID=UPI00332C8BE5
MRHNTLAKALATAVAVAALTTVGVSGAAYAAPAPPVAAPQAVTAVVNLGLTTTQAKHVQCFLDYGWGYNGAIDGLLGTNSWKAMQRYLAAQSYSDYNGDIDGIVGPQTVKALQRALAVAWGYTGPIDGLAGAGTKAAFVRFAETSKVYC